MNKDRFSYNVDLHQLELDGKALFEGELIEIYVLGHWIPGNLARDSSGWYLITLDMVGIRLREGLLARHPCRGLQAVGPSYERSERKADWAAKYPHIPWTPPPGGVDEERR